MDNSALSKNELAELAQGYVTQLRNLIYEQGLTFLEIGRLLKILRDEKLYAYLGEGGYDNFQQFVAAGDIGIKLSTAYALVGIYETYILKLGYAQEKLAEIPWTRLQALTSTVKHETKAEADEWIEKAKTLGNGDFATEINELRANTGWEHPAPYPRVYRCKDCGKWRVEVDEKYKCVCIG
jgi:hypothetical protein